jgi:hypothetical protein
MSPAREIVNMLIASVTLKFYSLSERQLILRRRVIAPIQTFAGFIAAGIPSFMFEQIDHPIF